MRVQDLYGVGGAEAGQPAAPQAGKAQPTDAVAPKGGPSEAAREAPPGSDQVQLSDLTGKLSGLLGAENPERAARLERLAAEVQSGGYRVDALAISRRLVDEALRGG